MYFFLAKNSPAPEVRICPYAYVYDLCLLFLSRVTGHWWCCIYCLSFHKIKKPVRCGGVQDATHCFQLFQPSWLKKLIYQTKLLGFGAIKDGAYYCYCAYVLRISRYSDFLSPMLTNTGIFLRGLKLSGESSS